MKLGPRRPRPERKNPRRSRGSRSGARGTRTPDLLGAIQAGVRADFVVSAGYLCRSRAQVGGRDFTHFPTISARIGPRTAVFGPTLQGRELPMMRSADVLTSPRALPCIEASAKRGQLTERVETLNHRQLAAAARAAGGAQVLRQSPLARPPSPEPRLDSSGHHTPRIPSPTSRAVPAITQRSESSIRQRMRAPERRGCLSGARRRTRRVAGSQDPRGIGRSVRW
jgi:hypothetical protein